MDRDRDRNRDSCRSGKENSEYLVGAMMSLIFLVALLNVMGTYHLYESPWCGFIGVVSFLGTKLIMAAARTPR